MILEVLLLAVALDILLGEPPARIHPVVLIGLMISALQRRAQPTRACGLAIALIVVFCTVATGHLLLKAASYMDIFGLSLGIVLSAYLLKSTIAIRSLLVTTTRIGHMVESDLVEARKMLPALVSRDTEDFSRAQASSAVIESLSENYVDTILSPIFYFLLFSVVGLGIEAALAYKSVNTLDSMLGYKTDDLIKLGYVSAKIDDLANWIPARLSVMIMAVAVPWRALPTIKTALRYHRAPASPNSGWPMAGAAGALGIRLEKPGSYTILCDGREPTTADIPRALKFIGAAMVLTLVLAILLPMAL